jgi:hypothetical protein
MTEKITDRNGRVIGFREVRGSEIIYSNVRYQVVARVMENGRLTVDGNGRFVGNGDQGMRLL